jgi:hypothetical protein
MEKCGVFFGVWTELLNISKTIFGVKWLSHVYCSRCFVGVYTPQWAPVIFSPLFTVWFILRDVKARIKNIMRGGAYSIATFAHCAYCVYKGDALFWTIVLSRACYTKLPSFPSFLDHSSDQGMRRACYTKLPSFPSFWTIVLSRACAERVILNSHHSLLFGP